jgi:TctA family transporter
LAYIAAVFLFPFCIIGLICLLSICFAISGSGVMEWIILYTDLLSTFSFGSVFYTIFSGLYGIHFLFVMVTLSYDLYCLMAWDSRCAGPVPSLVLQSDTH